MLLHNVGVSCGMYFKKWNYYIILPGYLQVARYCKQLHFESDKKKEASNPFKDILSLIKVIPTGIASS